MPDDLKKATFDPCVGTRFRVHVDENVTVALELTHVKELPPIGRAKELKLREEPFCLLFKSSDDVNLEQRLYKFEHEQLGTLDIFIVPVGFGEYEAVFN
jgi:hypothetical protein